MPDPRSVDFSTQIVVGYKGGGGEAWDEYGRRPGQPGYDDEKQRAKEHDTTYAFKGEYARVFGPRRRGMGFDHGKPQAVDSDDYHKYHLSLEGRFKPDGNWLGDMLGIINADPGHPLQPVYQDIDDINSFTAPHHHNTNTPFNEDEVRAYIARTLAIVGGC